MPAASTLRHLLAIRQRNARRLRRIRGHLGSAVGFKYHEDTGAFALDEGGAPIPAVLVFVRAKRPLDRLAPADRVPATLRGPGGLLCVTDVVVGALPALAPEPLPPSPANRRLLARLASGRIGRVGGLPLASPHARGTAACIVKSGTKVGLLTNWHVAGFPGTEIRRPAPRPARVGRTARTCMFAPHTAADPDDLESFTNARHRLDAAFVALDPATDPATVHPGVHGLGPLGRPFVLDLDTMGPIGRGVVGVGQRLGLQRGLIAAYGYEWRIDPESDAFFATDYLILGRDGAPFAAAGDSGKLVVTDDARAQPIALLWGGQRQEFWSAQAQESWAYASAIGTVLKRLRLRILR